MRTPVPGRGFTKYWGACWRRAFGSGLGLADLIAGATLALIAYLLRTVPERESMMSELAWIVPGISAALVLTVRFALAPYWMDRDKAEAVESFKDQEPRLQFGEPYEAKRAFRVWTTAFDAGGIINTSIQEFTSASGPYRESVIGRSSVEPRDQPTTQILKEADFAYVRVANANRNRGGDAVDAIVRLEFFDDETGTELLQLNGRWADNRLVDPTPGTPRDDVARRTLRTNGEISSIDIATIGDDYWYAVDDDSQAFLEWKNPSYALRTDRARVRITITAAGLREPFVGEFFLDRKNESAIPRIRPATT